MFIIIETQTNGGSVAIVPPASYEDKQTAEQNYHNSLAAAAVSNVQIHAVTMLDERGNRIKGEVYYHDGNEGE